MPGRQLVARVILMEEIKKHKSLNNPLRTCVVKVTYAYRIDPEI